jgi:hypothetical protein
MDWVVVNDGVCLDGTVADPAPPPLDPSMAFADGRHAAWRVTLFFGAIARGVMCRPTLWHQQNVKTHGKTNQK